jgi:hypothetical protein
MSDAEPPEFRLRFYGLSDHGTYFQVEDAFKLVGDFDSERTAYDVNDVLELHHAAQFTEHHLFPKDSDEADRADRRAAIPKIRRVVGTFFQGITDATVGPIVAEVDYEYRTDLLELMAKNRVFLRCNGSTVMHALQKANFHCGDVLSNRDLIRAYDNEVRNFLLASPRNAEQLIAKNLLADTGGDVHLPKSFTTADARALIDAYLDDPSANANFVSAVATARVNRNHGIDAKLKLKAQRTYDAWVEQLFKQTTGIKTGCEVVVSENQVEAVVTSMDGGIGKYSYSERWLSENLDYPTVLNNFAYLFGFADDEMMLLLPSFHGDLGVTDRFLKTNGKEAYRTGAAFNHTNQASFLQTAMYVQFLEVKKIDIEAVLAWFFAAYLKDEFGANNLGFRPSSAAATYLEKSRHLFSEMESFLKQFSLYAENGELDLDLLAITSEQLSYKGIPSLLGGKYVYATNQSEIRDILYALFSDQSGLCYINENLKADSFAHLIVANKLAYDDFHAYQKSRLDALIDFGVVANQDGHVTFASPAQFHVLRDLFRLEAVSYHHRSAKAKASIDEMIARGWLERRSSLLTSAESSYFNYFLNQSEFSDGPDLRNRYLHGSQGDGDDDRVHRNTYIIALRLIIALVIKINDDFNLNDSQDKNVTT